MSHLTKVIVELNTLQRTFLNLNHVRKILLAPFLMGTEDSSKNKSKNGLDISNPSMNAENVENESDQFRYLLRNSNFINLGDPVNKVVWGKVFHVVKDDLYIDFDWKFHCVCPRPIKNGELYVRGTEVLLKIKQLELSTKFLGAETGLTLLEAEADIVKLLKSPVKQRLK